MFCSGYIATAIDINGSLAYKYKPVKQEALYWCNKTNWNYNNVIQKKKHIYLWIIR